MILETQQHKQCLQSQQTSRSSFFRKTGPASGEQGATV